MAAFVRRVLMEEGGEVISSAGLLDFAQGFSGELGQPQSFVALHEALLRSPNWARFQTVSQGKLFVDRWFDGASKVFSVRESRHHLIAAGADSSSSYAAFECWDIDVQLSGAHINFVFQVRSHVLGTGGDVRDTLCDEEQFALTVDHVQLLKRSAQRKVKFLVHHFQIDNMREADKLRPIIVCPEDSGYHSDRRERLHKHKGRKGSTDSETIPFVYFCMEKLPSGILHFKELTLLLQPVIVRLDLVFWVKVGQQLFEWATVDSGSANAGSSAEDREIVAKQVFLLREGGIEVPSSSTTRHPVYFEYFRLGALIAQVEILMPMKSKLLKKRQANSGVASSMFEDEDDEQDAQMLQSMWLSQILARLTHRSHGLVKKVLMVAQKGLLFVVTSVGSGVLSGVGHMTPRFAFPETVFQRTLEDLMPFLYSLVRDYVKTGMYQFWKVLFSINLLGDPVGLTTSVTGGVMKFFRKTGSEVIAGDLKGEGLLSLAQGVVGGTAATAGKFFGALGDTVDALAQTGGDRDRHYQPGSVNHVGDGLTAGAQVFLHGATSGIAGLVQAPVQGFQRKGVVGLATGMLKGAAGLVAKPVSGLMHGVQHVAEGVDATTRLWDHAEQIVRRREPRGLPSGAKLVPLVGAEFSPRITVFLEALEFPTVESFYGTSAVMSRRLRGATYRVELSAQGSGGRWSKASKLGRLTRDGSVAFNEVKWVPTQTLVEADVVVEVQDCALS
ncbi:vps13A, partial [Symbiodinium sp. CCMP2592]